MIAAKTSTNRDRAGATPADGADADRILLFIPCYNCAGQIARVIGQLRGIDPAIFAEVLVLDNGSGDDTVQCAVRAAATVPLRVTIARNRRNYHLGGSHKAAFAHAARHGFSHVAVLHGDDQGDLADLLPLIRDGAHRQHDALLGARFARGARLQGYSTVRMLGNHAFNLLFSLVTRRRIGDLGSGLNVFARAVFVDAAIARASDDLRFNVFLLLQMLDAGRNVRFFPIGWRESDQVSNVRLVSQSLRTLAVAWDYATDRNGFRTGDHRDHVIDDYAFDVVAHYGGEQVARG